MDADIVITSTDKLMPGPRGGLMAGKEKYLDQIKIKANQFGLEAQPPSILAMVNGLRNFTHDNLLESYERKHELLDILSQNFDMFELTPTGVMVKPENLAAVVKDNDLTDADIAFIYSMILLKDWGIITIPAVSMPGASPTIRFDLSTADAFKLDLEKLNQIIIDSFKKLEEVVQNSEESKNIVFK